MSFVEMSPDASALLAWLAARGGTATVRDLGDTSPRRFRRAAVHGALVAELLAAGRIEQIGDRPRTYGVTRSDAPGAASSSASRLPAMLAEAVAECDGLPAELASYWGAVTLRDDLVERLLASKGMSVNPEHARAAHAVDDAMGRAFGCAVPA